MATAKNKRKRARLKNMKPFEIGAVPTGANKAVFIHLKQENGMKIDLAKLEQAHTQLGRIVMITKSGELSSEAEQDVAGKLAEFMALFGGQPPTTDAGSTEAAPPVELKSQLEDLKKDLGNITLATGVSDLAMDEQIDVVQGKIDDVLAQIATPAADPAAADAGTAEPVVPVVPAAEVAPAEAAPAAEVAPAAAEAAPADDGAAADAADAGNEPAADDGEKNKGAAPASTTFTADDMKTMFQAFAEGMKEVVKEAVGGAVKQVSKQLAAPVTIPAGSGVGSVEVLNLDDKAARSASSEIDHLESTDFNDFIDADDARQGR